jgi:RNA polymerase sigma-54 factor
MMQEVADELGIHVSTVSRAISGKHAQTHRGIYPLKFFFSGGTETSDGSATSRAAVKDRVEEIVKGEDSTKPLSDDDIAARLKDEGLSIARRTVTKYRKMLGIPSSRQRKVFE